MFAATNSDQDFTVKAELVSNNNYQVNDTYQVNNTYRHPAFREEDYMFPGDAPMDDETKKEAYVYYWSQMMHTLGHFHQLVSYPTSMPGPVRIANSFSRRGVAILQYNLNDHPDAMDEDEPEVLEKLNKWTYKDSKLRDQRFSA